MVGIVGGVLGISFGLIVILWLGIFLFLGFITAHFEKNAEKHKKNNELYQKDIEKIEKLTKVDNVICSKWTIIICLILFFGFLTCGCLVGEFDQSNHQKHNTKCEECGSHLSLKDIEHDNGRNKDYFYYECDKCDHIEKYDYSLK